MRTLDISVCDSTQKNTFTNNKCHEAKVCQKKFNISYLKLEPYSSAIVADLLYTCCGACVNVSEVNVLTKVSQITPSIMNSSHFVFPVLARFNVLNMYGYRFIALVETPSAYYITHKTENLIGDLIISCINMWPLMIICFLMVVISGFICWLMETWGNKEEFPRSFMVGWFEGIWWSFVSMTTVGYGDKVPKSVLARLFSLVWIVIGIATFSLVTAMLTSEVHAANSPPTPTMGGSKVGVIRHRLYEAILIAKHGGILIDIERANVTDGIHQLIYMLRCKQVDGFVLDQYTLLLFHHYFKDSSRYRDDVDFLKKKTTLTDISNTEDKFMYGVLVKNWDDYDFFVDYVIDNRDVINTCNTLFLNNYTRHVKLHEMRHSLFSPSSKLFCPSLITITIIVVIICCVGAFYENRRSLQGKWMSTTLAYWCAFINTWHRGIISITELIT